MFVWQIYFMLGDIVLACVVRGVRLARTVRLAVSRRCWHHRDAGLLAHANARQARSRLAYGRAIERSVCTHAMHLPILPCVHTHEILLASVRRAKFHYPNLNPES